jgi:hypothetical protein
MIVILDTGPDVPSKFPSSRSCALAHCDSELKEHNLLNLHADVVHAAVIQ